MSHEPHRPGSRATPPKFRDKSATRIAVAIFVASAVVVLAVLWLDLLPARHQQQVSPVGVWTDTDISGSSSPRPK